MAKFGRPEIETETTLSQACVDAGHPLSFREIGERAGLGRKAVQKRINRSPANWRRTEGTQPRCYPAGWTPLLVPDELEAEIRQRIEEHRQAATTRPAGFGISFEGGKPAVTNNMFRQSEE